MSTFLKVKLYFFFFFLGNNEIQAAQLVFLQMCPWRRHNESYWIVFKNDYRLFISARKEVITYLYLPLQNKTAFLSLFILFSILVLISLLFDFICDKIYLFSGFQAQDYGRCCYQKS